MEPQPSYGRAYLVMRFATAVAALTMPPFVVLGTLALEGDGRGSLSQYYHGPMRDFFVGALWAVALLLVTYRLTAPRSAEFVVSAAAGFGAIVLAFFPTARPGTEDGRGCDRIVEGRPCTPIQALLTETGSLALHVAGTVLFLGGAIVVCLVWARSAGPQQAGPPASVVGAAYDVDPAALVTTTRRARWVYLASAAVMVLALLFQVAVALPLHVPDALLWVELVCIAVFGVSWLAESLALLAALGARSEPRRRLAAARLAMVEARLSGRSAPGRG